MRSTTYQADSIRYIDSGTKPTSQTHNIATICGEIVRLTQEGELRHATHILQQLCRKYPARSHQIRQTIASMMADQAT